MNMIHTIDHKCIKCGKRGTKLLDEYNKDKNPYPSGWKYRDIGVDGEESYLLCSDCNKEYVELEKNLLRNFIKPH